MAKREIMISEAKKVYIVHSPTNALYIKLGKV